MWQTLSTALGILFTILIMVVVLVLAYMTTKLVGKRAYGQNLGAGNIKVLDRAYLAQDRALVIVQTAGKTMLLGVTPQHIEKLCDLEDGALTPLPSQQEVSFADTFKNVLSGLKMPGNGKRGHSDDED